MRGPRGTARQGNRSHAAMRLSVNTEGFAPWSGLVEVRSEVPVRVSVSLGRAPVANEVQVSDSATLPDPSRTAGMFGVTFASDLVWAERGSLGPWSDSDGSFIAGRGHLARPNA